MCIWRLSFEATTRLPSTKKKHRTTGSRGLKKDNGLPSAQVLCLFLGRTTFLFPMATWELPFGARELEICRPVVLLFRDPNLLQGKTNWLARAFVRGTSQLTKKRGKPPPPNWCEMDFFHPKYEGTIGFARINSSGIEIALRLLLLGNMRHIWATLQLFSLL